MEITLEMLKTQHPDIIAAIVAEATTQTKFDGMKKQTTDLQESVTALESTVTERDKTITEQGEKISVLEKENKDLKTKLDQKEVEEKLAAKKAMADDLLTKSKLPAEAKTAVFHEQLMGVMESGEGDTKITVAVGMQRLITDREEALLAKSGKPRNSGADYDPNKDIGGNIKKVTVEEASNGFLKTIGR